MEHTLITFTLGAIVSFAIFMYVLLDGFDLGVGIMFPFIKNQHHRQTMVEAIVPVWDGNETWLVLGGATLYGAFPVVYSTILPTLYLPIIIMLAALVFRGISFEFMVNAKRSRGLWEFFLSFGSLIAGFCQGLVLGTFVRGFSKNGVLISSEHYHWFTPFSVATGLAVVCGYVLLGSTWMVRKTEGELQDSMYAKAKKAMVAVFVSMLIVSLWTPYVDPDIIKRWFTIPNFYILLPLPLLALAAFIVLYRSLQRRAEHVPFYASMCIFLFAYIGFAMSVWPYIIPHVTTIWEAAAPFKAQVFILCGLLVLVPVLCVYTAYSYYVFRGKVKPGEAHY